MSPSKKKVNLKSNDGEIFEVDESIAIQSVTIKQFLIEEEENSIDDRMILLPNVKSNILSKVIEYCKNHIEEDEEVVKKWNAEFVNELDRNTLFDLTSAAHYLEIKGLMDLTCQALADVIKKSSVEEIRDYFNVKSDFSPEEEEEIKRMKD